MKSFFLFLLLIAPFYLCSQANNIHNGDFETISGTINCTYYPNPGVGSHNQDHLEEYWEQTPPWTVPERSFGLVTVATSDHICPGGNFGPTHGQMLNREYICQEMVSSLTVGKTYYIEFYVRKPVGGTLENAGIKFSLSRPRQWGYHQINIDNGSPDVEIDNNVAFPANIWVKYSTYYSPSANSNWITFGTFGKDVDFSQLFQIDDIRIVEWLPLCPYVQLIENWDYTGFQGVVLSAVDQLYAGYNVGSPRPNGNVIVQVGSEVRFKAGNEVGFFDGFFAADGSEFHAYNAPCNSDCFPPSPVAGIAADICDGSPYELGEPSGFNETYSWTSSPSNAINNLSSTTISNPVFTPPSNGSGTITYTVTATNSCGQTGSNSVSIHYETNPSQTVQLSLSNIVLGDIPSFDVNYDSHVKSVKIEVLDVSLATVFYTGNFLDVIDFNCCSFSWELPISLSPCMDYKIRVTATNYCTEAISSQTIDWVRNRSVMLTALLPNVVTPDGDGVNDQFCFQFTGANSYTLIVNSPSGSPVFVASNVVAYPTSACGWAGECNVGFPTCSGNQVGDGTYYFTLTLFGCDGQAGFETSGFLQLFNGTERIGQIEDSISLATEINTISVFPNPTSDGHIIVDLGNQSCQQIEIYNSIGQVIHVQIKPSAEKNQMILEGIDSGIYYLRILLDNGTYELKQVIVL